MLMGHHLLVNVCGQFFSLVYHIDLSLKCFYFILLYCIQLLFCADVPVMSGLFCRYI